MINKKLGVKILGFKKYFFMPEFLIFSCPPYKQPQLNKQYITVVYRINIFKHKYILLKKNLRIKTYIKYTFFLIYKCNYWVCRIYLNRLIIKFFKLIF